MSILFSGYYGHLNTGDDIFGVISDWGARKYWGQESIEFLGDRLPMRFDNSSLKSSYTSNLNFKGKGALESIKAGIKNSQIIYAGGSIFNSKIHGFSKNNIFRNLNKLKLVELGAIGVSVGPYDNDAARQSIREYLSHFNFISLRDKQSYTEVKTMNLNIPVIEAFDLAALLPELYPIEKKINTNPVLGISICNYESYTGKNKNVEKMRIKNIYSVIKETIKKIPELHIKILVFNAHPTLGDLELSNELISNIPKDIPVERIDYHPNPYFMWKHVASCNAVLATRLHAGMFACFSNTPFMQIEYHRKCSDFLDDISYPEEFRIGDIALPTIEVTNRLVKLLEFDEEFIKNKELIREKALLNFTGFKGII